MTECNTHYILEGDSCEIKELYRKIAKNRIDLGGSISNYDKPSPTSIWAEVLTRHREDTAPFSALMRQYPSLRCYFSAQNIEIGYYVTNDHEGVHFPERYIIIYSDCEPIFCNDLDQFYTEISLLIGEMIASCDKLVEAISRHNKTHNLDKQIRVSEVILADDLRK